MFKLYNKIFWLIVLVLLPFNQVFAEDFSNIVNGVNVRSAGGDSVYVDVYITSKDAKIKPELSTRTYQKDKFIIDLMNVTKEGSVSKDTSRSKGLVSNGNVKIGKLPGGTARVLIDLDNPELKIKDVRYHIVPDKRSRYIASRKKATPVVIKKNVVPVGFRGSKVKEHASDKPDHVAVAEDAQADSPSLQVIHKTNKKKDDHTTPKHKVETVDIHDKLIAEVDVEHVQPDVNHKVKTTHDVPSHEGSSDSHDMVDRTDKTQTEKTVEEQPKDLEQLPLNLDTEGTDTERNLRFVDVDKTTTGEFNRLVLTILTALAILIPLIFITLWIINKFYRGGGQLSLSSLASSNPNHFKIITSTALGQGRTIHLVEIKGRQLVIGCTNNSINILTEFTDFDEFVEKQRPSGSVSDLKADVKHKRNRPNIKTFEDLYMDYKTKIDEKDLEDEY